MILKAKSLDLILFTSNFTSKFSKKIKLKT